MNREEFIELAGLAGYCGREKAEKFCADREEFTDADFIDLWRYNYGDRYPGNENEFGKYRYYEGVKTTKHLRNFSPDNWNPGNKEKKYRRT